MSSPTANHNNNINNQQQQQPLSGWLRKRPRFGGHWPSRFFVLDKATLLAYSTDKLKQESLIPALPTHVYRLNAGTITVSEPFEKKVRTAYNAPLKEKHFAVRVSSGDAIVFTIATTSLEEARKWKKAIEAASKLKGGGDNLPSSEASSSTVLGDARKPIKSVLPDGWGHDDHWKVVDVTQEGLKIEGEKEQASGYPSLRAKAVVDGTPDAVFKVLMDDTKRTQWDDGIQSCTVLKKVSDTCHIVRLETRGIYVGPLYTDPRDLVLIRYWRKEEDSNAYVITWQSVEDPALSAPREGFVRGKILAMGFSISPVRDNPKQSTVRVFCHADPGGSFGLMPSSVLQPWLYPFVTRVIGLQKYLESGGKPRELEEDKADDDAAISEEINSSSSATTSSSTMLPKEIKGDEVNTLKFGTFPAIQWCETPHEEPFRVRGKTYLDDGIKILTSRNMFHVCAADLNKIDSPMLHCAARSDSPLRKIQTTYPDRQVFVLQFCMPGPPYYSMAIYAVSKPDVLDPSTPFGRLWNDFVEGTDEYRNSTLKLIPRVTKGAYVVRKTVGDTPALLGKKINSKYFVGPNYIEADVDISTSAVGASILSVFKGYSTSLTADLAFTLEGHSEAELPEQILCAVRMIKPDIGGAVKLGPDPDPKETARLRAIVEQGEKGEFKRQGSDMS
jgi:hypothetical protein